MPLCMLLQGVERVRITTLKALLRKFHKTLGTMILSIYLTVTSTHSSLWVPMVRRVEKVLTKTFHPTTWTTEFGEHQRLCRSSTGFTLIELLVVLGIIVMISIMVMPNVSSYFQLSLNSASRGLGSTIKEAY